MSVNRTSLGKRISFYRSKSNLTQEVLAAKVNCSREYIVQIENGTKVPSLSVLVKIANTLSVSADELLLDCLEYSSHSLRHISCELNLMVIHMLIEPMLTRHNYGSFTYL